jgi:hypothetical protein
LGSDVEFGSDRHADDRHFKVRVAENSYHFVTHWRVDGTCAEVADLLEDAEELPRWWPSVYLEAIVVERGRGPHGLGDQVSLFSKGWLPYTLRWRYTIIEQNYPYGFTLIARGDFDGRGEWVFKQSGDMVDATYLWDIKAEKPLVRALTPLLRPIFSANHRWAMRMGERSLQLELRRRHARTDEERKSMPPPRGPTFYRMLGSSASRRPSPM